MPVADDDGSHKKSEDKYQIKQPEHDHIVYIIEWMAQTKRTKLSNSCEVDFGSLGPFTRIARVMPLLATLPSFEELGINITLNEIMGAYARDLFLCQDALVLSFCSFNIPVCAGFIFNILKFRHNNPLNRYLYKLLIDYIQDEYLNRIILKDKTKLRIMGKTGHDRRCVMRLKQVVEDADEQNKNNKYILTLKYDGFCWTVRWYDKNYYEQYRGYKEYMIKKNPHINIREIPPRGIKKKI